MQNLLIYLLKSTKKHWFLNRYIQGKLTELGASARTTILTSILIQFVYFLHMVFTKVLIHIISITQYGNLCEIYDSQNPDYQFISKNSIS